MAWSRAKNDADEIGGRARRCAKEIDSRKPFCLERKRGVPHATAGSNDTSPYDLSSGPSLVAPDLGTGGCATRAHGDRNRRTACRNDRAMRPEDPATSCEIRTDSAPISARARLSLPAWSAAAFSAISAASARSAAIVSTLASSVCKDAVRTCISASSVATCDLISCNSASASASVVSEASSRSTWDHRSPIRANRLRNFAIAAGSVN